MNSNNFILGRPNNYSEIRRRTANCSIPNEQNCYKIFNEETDVEKRNSGNVW